MALSADKPLDYKGIDHRLVLAQPVQASTTIYQGGALTRDAGGEVGPASGAETFAGFAADDADNSSGSAGDINVKVYDRGLVLLTITGLDDNDDIGDVVYATADDTFTLTASNASSIGRVVEIESLSDNTAWVFFEADTARSI